jgi:hypothetical protein
MDGLLPCAPIAYSIGAAVPMDGCSSRVARKDAAITAHPLSTHLRAAAQGAPNAVALIALAEEVDAPSPSAAQALQWFDTTVRLVSGRYEPCAPVRRRLRHLSPVEDPAQTIARLAAEELTTRAVLRDGPSPARRRDRPFPRSRG